MHKHTTQLRLRNYVLRVGSAAYRRYLAGQDDTPISSVLRSRISSLTSRYKQPSRNDLFWEFRTQDELEVAEIILRHNRTKERPANAPLSAAEFDELIGILQGESWYYPGVWKFLERVRLGPDVPPRYVLRQKRRLRPLRGYGFYREGHPKRVLVTVSQDRSKETREFLQKHCQVMRQSRPLKRKGGSVEVCFETTVPEDQPDVEAVVRNASPRNLSSPAFTLQTSDRCNHTQSEKKQRKKTSEREKKSRRKGMRRERRAKQNEQQHWAESKY